MTRHPCSNNEQLLRKFDEWVATRGGTANIDNVLASGDHRLFAAFILKNFGKAAREPVFDRFRIEAWKRGFCGADTSTSTFFFVLDCIAEAWALTDADKIALLAVETVTQLDAIRKAAFEDVTPETLERAAILLEMYIVLHAIFSDHSLADDWIRLPNSASLFEGRSALAVMLERGLPTFRSVRQYLWAQAAGN